MRALLVACFVGLAVLIASSTSSGAPPKTADSRLAVLYRHDPLRHSISFATGADGSGIENGTVVNVGSDVDFGTYGPDALTIAIEGGRIGVLLDLGSQDALARRYGFVETAGKGQGFASIRLDGESLVIRGPDLTSPAMKGMVESAELFGPAVSAATRLVTVGHVYLARLTDSDDRSFERIVKILVVAHTPGESVTIRWSVLTR